MYVDMMQKIEEVRASLSAELDASREADHDMVQTLSSELKALNSRVQKWEHRVQQQNDDKNVTISEVTSRLAEQIHKLDRMSEVVDLRISSVEGSLGIVHTLGVKVEALEVDSSQRARAVRAMQDDAEALRTNISCTQHSIQGIEASQVDVLKCLQNLKLELSRQRDDSETTRQQQIRYTQGLGDTNAMLEHELNALQSGVSEQLLVASAKADEAKSCVEVLRHRSDEMYVDMMQKIEEVRAHLIAKLDASRESAHDLVHTSSSELKASMMSAEKELRASFDALHEFARQSLTCCDCSGRVDAAVSFMQDSFAKLVLRLDAMERSGAKPTIAPMLMEAAATDCCDCTKTLRGDERRAFVGVGVGRALARNVGVDGVRPSAGRCELTAKLRALEQAVQR